MYAGRMVEGANSEELISHPAHPYTELLLSAVPNPQQSVKRELKARTDPPRLIDPPPGCPFAPRCPKVMSVCREVMPGVVHLSSNHWVRCHLFGSGEVAGTTAKPA